jgi:hypothetical protein
VASEPVRKLGAHRRQIFFAQAQPHCFHMRTALGYGPHFNGSAVFQCRTALGNRGRLVEALYLKEEIAGNSFL